MTRRRRSVVRNNRTQAGPCRVEILESRMHLSAVKMMPLGDSITESDTAHSGYRYWLFKQLTAGGFDVDFVGSNRGAYGGAPLYGDFDQDHEGHSGWRADTLAGGLTSWAPAYKPDVALVHVGTNDIGQGQSTASTLDDVKLVIDRLRAGNPAVTILLAAIIPTASHTAAVTQFNAALPGVVAAKATPQSRVVLVDQWTGFDTATDTYDGTHPNEAGARKMAAKWYAAVDAALRPGQAPPAPPVGSTTYLSDLTPAYAANFWGRWEKDRSNGEQSLGDGRTVTLNGKAYAKGLGLHAAAELRYDLSGKYARFQSDIGVDDEVGNGGSVVFKIFADDVLIFDGGKLTGASATKTVDLDVGGKKTLKLVVDNAGDGAAYDHADFADARLIAGAVTAPSPIVVPPGVGTPVYLGDITAVSAVNGWGAYEKNRSNNEQGSNDGRPLTINGKAYAKGLGTHADSSIIFNVPAGARRFVSDVGVDDEVGNAGSVFFKVYSGATLLFASAKITGASVATNANVDLAGVTQLRLVVEDSGDGKAYDHADWADARFTF